MSNIEMKDIQGALATASPVMSIPEMIAQVLMVVVELKNEIKNLREEVRSLYHEDESDSDADSDADSDSRSEEEEE